MRGFHLLIIWVMALAVTVAYAGKVQAPSKDVKDDYVQVDPKKEKIPEDVPEEIVHVDEDDDEVVVEPEPEIEPPRRHFSLQISAGFGRSLGCVIPNCGAFMPVQRVCGGYYVQGYSNYCAPPPQYSNVVYQDVYVHEHPSNFQMRGFCPCQGQAGCGCGAQAPVLIVNNVPPIMSPRIGWDGVNGRTAPVWGPQPQAVFQVPGMPQQHLGNRNTGFIPREGFAPTAGSF